MTPVFSKCIETIDMIRHERFLGDMMKAIISPTRKHWRKNGCPWGLHWYLWTVQWWVWFRNHFERCKHLMKQLDEYLLQKVWYVLLWLLIYIYIFTISIQKTWNQKSCQQRWFLFLYVKMKANEHWWQNCDMIYPVYISDNPAGRTRCSRYLCLHLEDDIPDWTYE